MNLVIPADSSSFAAGIAGDMSKEARIIETAMNSVFCANKSPGRYQNAQELMRDFKTYQNTCWKQNYTSAPRYIGPGDLFTASRNQRYTTPDHVQVAVPRNATD